MGKKREKRKTFWGIWNPRCSPNGKQYVQDRFGVLNLAFKESSVSPAIFIDFKYVCCQLWGVVGPSYAQNTSWENSLGTEVCTRSFLRAIVALAVTWSHRKAGLHVGSCGLTRRTRVCQKWAPHLLWMISLLEISAGSHRVAEGHKEGRLFPGLRHSSLTMIV